MDIEIFEPITAQVLGQVRASLSGQPPEIPVTFSISSYGGDVFAGLAIAELIFGLPNPTTAKIYGVAASAAAIIALSCDTVIMTDMGAMMIHETRGAKSKPRDDPGILQANALQNKIISRRLPGFDVNSLRGSEWWIDAETALARGLADKVFKVTDDTPERLVALCGSFSGAMYEDTTMEDEKKKPDQTEESPATAEAEPAEDQKDEVKADAAPEVNIMDLLDALISRVEALEKRLADEKADEERPGTDVVEARARMASLYARAATICAAAPRSPAPEAMDPEADLRAAYDRSKKLYPNINSFTFND